MAFLIVFGIVVALAGGFLFIFANDGVEALLGIIGLILGIGFLVTGLTHDSDQAKDDLTRQGFSVSSVDTDHDTATVRTPDNCLVNVTFVKDGTTSKYVVVQNTHILSAADVTCTNH